MTYPKQPSRTSRSTRNFTPRASLKGNAKSKFYAVRNGRGGISGIFDNWQQTQAVVSGVRGAKHKSFRTLEEAQAFLGSDATPAQTMVQPRPYLSDNQTGTSIVPSIPTASTDLSCPDVANQNAVQSLPSLPVHDAATQLARAAPEPCPDSPVSLSVYTDGACTKNGKPGAKAGYGVFFGDDNPYNLSEPLEGHPTNQRAEMTAALEAMRIVLNHGLVARGGRVIVHSDSQYTINGITSWVHNWKKRGWKTAAGLPVKNQELWLQLEACREALALKGIGVVFEWVKGHAGVHGNEMADRLAVHGMYNR